MKKERGRLFVHSLFVFILFLSVTTFINAQIIKPNKNQYYAGDSVYISSSISSSDHLCRGVSSTTVSLFIVEHADSWSESEPLNDVRGSSSDISNTQFSLKKVWENSVIGQYDLIVDCNNNSQYDTSEPVFDEGFSIAAKKGSGLATRGAATTDAVSWNYNPEALVDYTNLLQLQITGKDEDILLKNMSLRFSKNGLLILEELSVSVDSNGNGQYDSDEMIIGELVLDRAITDEYITLPLDYTLQTGISPSFIILLSINENSSQGSYSFDVTSLQGEGATSEKTIFFGGFPIHSKDLVILPRQSCIGSLQLALSPPLASEEGTVNALINGMTNCDERTAFLKSNFCYVPSSTVGNCVLSRGACSVTFNASRSVTYFACLDKNNDGDYADFGESVYTDFVLLSSSLPRPSHTENESESESESISLTGNTIKTTEPNVTSAQGLSFTNYFRETNPSLLILEGTLILIFVILVMIFFRLRGTSVPVVEERTVSVPSSDLLSDNQPKEKKERKGK